MKIWFMIPNGFGSIKDKETYITYLSGKFATIRNQASSKPNASFAYYGDIENNSGAPCLILSQHNSEFLLLIKIKDQKIFKMDLCMIPMAKEAINFDWSPY